MCAVVLSSMRIPSVIGRYRILRLLGKGGMGCVYLAEHLDARWLRALKTLHVDEAHEGALGKRFVREVRAAAEIDHRNVVKIYEFSEDENGSFYYVMEYLEGEDLRALLKRRGAVPWDELRDLLQQALHGLNAAHARGIIHRDVKPENFVIVKEPTRDLVKLIDFGIAKIAPPEGQTATKTDMPLGTAAYIAPEQAMQQSVDRRTDIYSFGAMAYHLLTGSTPFGGAPMQQVMAHVQNELFSPRERFPELNIAEAVDDLILKCMAKNPADRFQTCDELILAIQATVPQQLQPAPPTKSPGVRLSTRARTYAALGIIASLSTGAYVAVDSVGTKAPIEPRAAALAPIEADIAPTTPGQYIPLKQPEAPASPVTYAVTTPEPAVARVMTPAAPTRALPSCLAQDWKYVKDKIRSEALRAKVSLSPNFEVTYMRKPDGKVDAYISNPARSKKTELSKLIGRVFQTCEIRRTEKANASHVFNY